jgi:hypothetical protein
MEAFGKNGQMFHKPNRNPLSLFLGSSKNSHACTKFKQIDYNGHNSNSIPILHAFLNYVMIILFKLAHHQGTK